MVAVQPFTIPQRIWAEKIATDNGFGLTFEINDDWALATGLAVRQTLSIGRAGNHWVVGLAHAGAMAAVLEDTPAAPMPRPDGGPAVLVAEDGFGSIVRRLFRLARSLPTAPLDAFVAKIKTMPDTTEALGLAVRRIGQDVFRDALLDYWGRACPLTGVTHPRLLRASHMKPWADCETDAERLDVHNGLLLAAHLDAAFDAGLISFAADGALLVADALRAPDRAALGLTGLPPLSGLKAAHAPYLAWHREAVFGHRPPRPPSP